jgi:hypothetical protein
MGNDRTGLTERITFAEDWLDRARQQIEDGDLNRGTLTLILAEAEVHRAREVTMTAPVSTVPARGRVHVHAAGMVIGALALAAAVVVASAAVLQFKTPVQARDLAPVSIVRLSAGTGEMLSIVVAPEPVVERTVEKRIILRVPVPVAVAVRDDRPIAPVLSEASPAAPLAVTPRVAASAVVPVAPASITAAPVVAPAPALLNEADVIDLVLAAERSLRRSAKQ